MANCVINITSVFTVRGVNTRINISSNRFFTIFKARRGKNLLMKFEGEANTKVNQVLLISVWAVGFFAALYVFAPLGYQTFSDPSVGESYIAFHSAFNVVRFGFPFGLEYGLLENHATSASIEAHPYLYIHHLNIGLFLSLIFRQIEIYTFTSQSLAVGVIFYSIILFFALYIYGKTNNYRISLLIILFLAYDYESVSRWAFNIHRGLGLGSAILFVLLALNIKNLKSIPVLIVGVVSAFVLMGADYIYLFTVVIWVISYLVLTAYINPMPWVKTGEILRASIVFSWLIIAFLIRQLQVIYGVGFSTWANDFIFQVLNRFGLERIYRGTYSVDVIKFYENQQIQNPGMAPVMSLTEAFSELISKMIFGFSRYISKGIEIQEFGGILISIFVILAVLIYWNLKAPFPYRINFIESVNPKNGNDFLIISVMSRCVLASVIALVIMTMLFTRYFIQWLPSYNLLAAGIYLFFGFGLFLFIGRLSNLKFIFAMIIILIIRINPYIQDLDSTSQNNRLLFEQAVNPLKGKFVATNFIPESVSTYTHNFTTMLSDDGIEFLAKNGFIHPATRFLFNEKDEKNTDYLAPEFIVLQLKEELSIRIKSLSGVRIWDEGPGYAVFRLEDDLRSNFKNKLKLLQHGIESEEIKLSCVAREGVLRLKWNVPSYIHNLIIIQMASNGSPLGEVGTMGANQVSYTIGGINKDISYDVRIVVKVGNMFIGKSNVVTCAT